MHIATITTKNVERLSRTDMTYHVQKISVAMSSMIGLASSNSAAAISLPVNAAFDNTLFINLLHGGGITNPFNLKSLQLRLDQNPSGIEGYFCVQKCAKQISYHL